MEHLCDTFHKIFAAVTNTLQQGRELTQASTGLNAGFQWTQAFRHHRHDGFTEPRAV